MPINVNCRVDASALGITASVDRGVVADDAAISKPTVPRAKVGTLSTRTDNDTGVLTLEASHGVTTGATNKIDVYWSGGCRYGMTVGTVSGTSVPIDGGAGDNLPVVDTAVTAVVPQKENFNCVGDNVVAVLARAGTRAVIKLQTSVPAVIQTIVLQSADDGYSWTTALGTTNPLAGETIASVLLSHDDGVNSQTVGVTAPFN